MRRNGIYVHEKGNGSVEVTVWVENDCQDRKKCSNQEEVNQALLEFRIGYQLPIYYATTIEIYETIRRCKSYVGYLTPEERRKIKEAACNHDVSLEKYIDEAELPLEEDTDYFTGDEDPNIHIMINDDTKINDDTTSGADFDSDFPEESVSGYSVKIKMIDQHGLWVQLGIQYEAWWLPILDNNLLSENNDPQSYTACQQMFSKLGMSILAEHAPERLVKAALKIKTALQAVRVGIDDESQFSNAIAIANAAMQNAE